MVGQGGVGRPRSDAITTGTAVEGFHGLTVGLRTLRDWNGAVLPVVISARVMAGVVAS